MFYVCRELDGTYILLQECKSKSVADEMVDVFRGHGIEAFIFEDYV